MSLFKITNMRTNFNKRIIHLFECMCHLNDFLSELKNCLLNITKTEKKSETVTHIKAVRYLSVGRNKVKDPQNQIMQT